jgi:hypothetical protein
MTSRPPGEHADDEKYQLIRARRGQGNFRKALESIGTTGCPVTGHTAPELLRASHIMPWREAGNRQRLDPIRPGRRVVGRIMLGAIGSISVARYHGVGVPIGAGVVGNVAVAIIGVVVAKISIGVVVATIAITQRATGNVRSFV